MDSRAQVVSAICGFCAGPVLLVASWAGVLAQPEEYSFLHHASSDLGADTADAAWLSNQLGSNLPGALLTVFAVGLGYALGDRISARIGAGLIGVVGVGFFLTGFFTLDCREIDAGCSERSMSWQANTHVTVALVILLALGLSPFVLARALKFLPRWRDLRITTFAFGVGTIVVTIAVSAVVGEGLGQYAAVIAWFAWITILSLRMLRLARSDAS
jgi:Protein of unknown function (DUF998)